MRPTTKIMNEIRKTGARAIAIKRSKEEAIENDQELRKRHLYEESEREKERERKREESSGRARRIRELVQKEEEGLILTNSEENELEGYREEEDNNSEED
jgi:hypothetical protein